MVVGVNVERTLNLNDKTTINLFAVLGVLPVFIGFVFWMSTTWADVVNIKTALAEKNKVDEQQMSLLLDIRERLIRLESHNAKKGRGD